MILLKIVVAVIIAVLIPVIFFRISKFLAGAFLEDEGPRSRWRILFRVNMTILVAGYCIGVGIFARDLFRHFNEAYFHKEAAVSPASLSASEDRDVRETDDAWGDAPHATEPLPFKARPMPVRGVITLAGNPRFAANWEVIPEGLRITRLGDGPMKKSGIRVGDIITSVDGQAVSNEKILLAVRDRIVDGQAVFAELLVEREDVKLRFHITR